MASVAIDTLRFARRLEAGGFSAQQAAAAAEALAETLRDIPDLATRADVRELELRLDARMEATKAEILKWMFGGMVAQTGVIVALLKLIP